MAHTSCSADHKLDRGKVCAPYGQKVKNLRNVTGNLEVLLKKHFPFYDSKDPHFPRSICNTCRVVILSVEKNGSNTSKLPVMPNYQEISLIKETRSALDSVCYCHICLKARSFAHIKGSNGGGRGKKRSLSPDISEGLMAAQESKPINLPSSLTKPIPKSSIKICVTCRLTIGPGIKHDCKTTNATKNIVNALDTMSPKIQEQVASSIIRSKAQCLDGSSKNVEVTLRSKGNTSRVVINASTASVKPTISHESLRQSSVWITQSI